MGHAIKAGHLRHVSNTTPTLCHGQLSGMSIWRGSLAAPLCCLPGPMTRLGWVPPSLCELFSCMGCTIMQLVCNECTTASPMMLLVGHDHEYEALTAGGLRSCSELLMGVL